MTETQTKKVKHCNTCGETKELTVEHWNRYSSSPDGFNSQCKACVAKYNSEWRKKKLANLAKTTTISKKDTVVDKKTAEAIQDSMNGLSKVAETMTEIKIRKQQTESNEEDSIDERLILAVRSYYYYLLDLPSDKNGVIQLGQKPSEFIKTFRLKSVAAIYLFHSYVEYEIEGGFKWKRKLGTLQQFAEEYKKLISVSEMVKEPSINLIGEDLSTIKGSQLAIERKLTTLLEHVEKLATSLLG